MLLRLLTISPEATFLWIDQNAEKQDHDVEDYLACALQSAIYMLGASIRDLRPRKLIHEERLLPKSTIRKNRVHFRPVLITFLRKHVTISWRKLYLGARFHFLRSGKVEYWNNLRLNEEKIVLPIGKPPLVTHSAALLATLPALKQSKVVRMLVWCFSFPERKLQSHEAIKICDTSQIIIYRASFLSILDSEMALFEVQ